MKSSKRLLVAVGALAAWAILLGNLGAQTRRETRAVPTRVAVCDIAEVFNNYKRAKDLTARLDARRRRIKGENEKRSKAIESLQMELEGLKEGSKKYEQTFNEIQRLTIGRQAWLQVEDSLAVRDHLRLTKEMYDEILAMVVATAKGKGLDLVLYREGKTPPTQNITELLRAIRARKVLYSADTIDITEETLRRINETYTKANKG
ncbi:MAG: OmpH family outer membrane protein [Phycisphaerae bacterium]|nr:OmpH family outer membrane protein [Phycisphaerae bacterium]